MDINELNKMSVVAQFNKLISQSNFSVNGTESFSGLLEKNVSVAQEDTRSSVTEKETSVEKKDYKTEAKNTNKEDVKDTSQTSENKKKEPVSDKSETKADEEAKTPIQDKEQEPKEPSEDNDKDISAQAAAMTAAPVENVAQPVQNTAEEGTQDVISEAMADTASKGTEMTSGEDNQVSTLMSDIMSGKVQVLDAQGNVIPVSELTPDNLADMDNVSIKNTQTSEISPISGQELSSRLFETVQEEIAAPLLPEETMPMAEQASENLAAALKNVKGNKDEANVSQQKISEDSLFENVEGELISEEKINELLSDKQVKVDLSVKEEKNSYFVNRDLVKNSFVLNKTVEEGEAEAPMISANNQPTSSNAQNLQSGVASAQPQAIQMPISGNEDVQNLQNVANVDVKASTGSAGSTSSAIMSGAEFVAASRTDATEKNNQTSFKDVYKGMSKEAVEQVKVNITKSAVKGVDTIEVRLKPEELGHIEIKMQIKDGKLQAHIISNRPETMEALQKDAQILEKAFNDAGFQTDGNSLSFSFRNQGNQAQAQNEQLRSFIGKVFEQEANSDVITADAANQNWSAERGLNIRV